MISMGETNMLDNMMGKLGWNYILPNLLPAAIWTINIRIYLLFFHKRLFILLSEATKDYSLILYIIVALTISVFIWGTSFIPRQLNSFLIDRFWKINKSELSPEMSKLDINNRIILSTSLFNLSFSILFLALLCILSGVCAYVDLGLLLTTFSVIAFFASIYYSREIFIIKFSKNLDTVQQLRP